MRKLKEFQRWGKGRIEDGEDRRGNRLSSVVGGRLKCRYIRKLWMQCGVLNSLLVYRYHCILVGLELVIIARQTVSGLFSPRNCQSWPVVPPRPINGIHQDLTGRSFENCRPFFSSRNLGPRLYAPPPNVLWWMWYRWEVWLHPHSSSDHYWNTKFVTSWLILVFRTSSNLGIRIPVESWWLWPFRECHEQGKDRVVLRAKATTPSLAHLGKPTHPRCSKLVV